MSRAQRPLAIASAPAKTKSEAMEKRLDELLMHGPELTGVASRDVALSIAFQVARALVHPQPKDDTLAIIGALEAVNEMAPKGPVQAMLAAQMIATNQASAKFLAASLLDEQTLESRTANVNRAARLMQIYLLQIEAFEKLRGNSVQQKMVVEHVHIHEGGQAIVGALTSGFDPVSVGPSRVGPMAGGGTEK
jgi:hypothetical protein